VLLGARWHVAGDVLAALAGLGLGGALSSVGGETFKAAGRPVYAFRMQLLALVTTIGLTAVLLPVGIVAAAAGVSIASIVVGGYAVFRAARIVEMADRAVIAEIWPPVLGGLVAAAVAAGSDALLLHAADRGTVVGILFVAIEILLGAVAYSAVLRLVAPARADDLRPIVRSFVRRQR
jgi:PST family polysaccharide transporter